MTQICVGNSFRKKSARKADSNFHFSIWLWKTSPPYYWLSSACEKSPELGAFCSAKSHCGPSGINTQLSPATMHNPPSPTQTPRTTQKLVTFLLQQYLLSTTTFSSKYSFFKKEFLLNTLSNRTFFFLFSEMSNTQNNQTKEEQIADLERKIAEILILNDQYWASIDKLSLQLHEDDNEFTSAQVSQMQRERSSLLNKVMDLKPLIRKYDEELRLLKAEASVQ